MACWCIWRDICGLFCWAIGEAVVWFANYVTVFYVILPWFKSSWLAWLQIVLFESVVALVVITHLRAMLTDPGCIKLNSATRDEAEPPEDKRDTQPTMRYCNICQAIKPSRAHHCSVANRCVMRMDHYCPWVNNTVGQNNYKYFLQFLLYVEIGCLYAAIATCARGWWCYSVGPCWRYSTFDIGMMVLSAILALLFAIFVGSMMYDQYEGLISDTTGVEAMKEWCYDDVPFYEGMKRVMGCSIGWQWFLPVTPHKSALYEWSEKDKEPDFDPRDPRVQNFLARRRQWNLQRQKDAQNTKKKLSTSGNHTSEAQRLHRQPDFDRYSQDDDLQKHFVADQTGVHHWTGSTEFSASQLQRFLMDQFNSGQPIELDLRNPGTPEPIPPNSSSVRQRNKKHGSKKKK